MTQNITIVNFLAAVLPNDGIHALHTGWHKAKLKPGEAEARPVLHNKLPENLEAAATFIEENRETWNVYHSLHSFKRVEVKQNAYGGTYKHLSRTQANAAFVKTFYADLDVNPAEPKKFASKKEAVDELFRFCDVTNLPTPMVVSSGNGYHVYWLLDADMPSDEWKPYAEKMKSLFAHHGFKADPAVTADMARVLRPVGSFNRKNEASPKLVKVVGEMPDRIPVVDMLALIDKAYELVSVKEAEKKGGSREPIPETPTNIAVVASMLAAIDPDIERLDWVKVVFAVLSTGWICAERLARDWSFKGAKWVEGEFTKVVTSFKPDGKIGVGSLVHFAQKHGYAGPGLEQGAPLGIDEADIANGRRFAQVARGLLLWVFGLGAWMKFDLESGYVAAEEIEVEAFAKTVVDRMGSEAREALGKAPHDPTAKKMVKDWQRASHRPHMRAMIEMAKSEPGMTASLNDFDTDAMQLGVLNGVLNLRTGELLAFSSELRVSKKSSVVFDPHATCPHFATFLNTVVPSDGMRGFLRRFVGYCLTGRVDAQVWLFLHGSGANGKSVFVETIAHVLGDYARKLAIEALMDDPRSSRNRDQDKLTLKGTRFAYSSETEEGRKLSEAQVKELTGGDTITARPHYQQPVSFAPTHKLMLSGNHRPAIGDASHGMWRRIALVGFDVTIAEDDRDPDLSIKLRAEAVGILNWALAGLREWLDGGGGVKGLAIPNAIKAATAGYQADEDVLGQFIDERCTIDATAKVGKAELYDAFTAWSAANGRKYPPTGHWLSRQLGDRGFKPEPGRRFILGLKLAR